MAGLATILCITRVGLGAVGQGQRNINNNFPPKIIGSRTIPQSGICGINSAKQASPEGKCSALPRGQAKRRIFVYPVTRSKPKVLSQDPPVVPQGGTGDRKAFPQFLRQQKGKTEKFRFLN